MAQRKPWTNSSHTEKQLKYSYASLMHYCYMHHCLYSPLPKDVGARVSSRFKAFVKLSNKRGLWSHWSTRLIHNTLQTHCIVLLLPECHSVVSIHGCGEDGVNRSFGLYLCVCVSGRTGSRRGRL